MLRSLRLIATIWGGLVLGALISFVTQALLARSLSLSEYGSFAAVMNLVSMAAPLAALGMASYWLRQFGLYGWNAKYWVPASIKLVFLFFLLCATCLILVALYIWPDPGMKVIIILLIPSILMTGFTDMGAARLQLEERYIQLAYWRILPQTTRFLTVLLVFCMSYGVLEIAIGYCFTAVILAALAFRMVLPLRVAGLDLKGHGQKEDTKPLSGHQDTSMKAVLSGVWPFAIGGIFNVIYFQSVIIMLSLLVDNEAAGLYNAAFTLLLVVYLIPRAIFQQYLLPKYHRWAEHNTSRFLNVYRFSNSAMLVAGVVLMICVMILAPILVPMIFGAKFAPAGKIVFWVALSIPIRFLSSSVGGSLVTKNCMRKKVKYQGLVAVINITLNILLIPMYQLNGAIATTIISEALLLVCFLYGARKHVFGIDALTGWHLNWKSINE